MVMGGGLGKISNSIELVESKKNEIEKSILSLVVQWEEFECELNSAEKDLCEGLRQLDSKEQRLNYEREWMEERIRDIRNRESDFLLFREKKIRDLERKEREFEKVREAYGTSVGESLGVQEKRVEGLLEKLKSEKIEMEDLRNFLEKRSMEIELEEEDLKNRRKEVEMISISIEERIMELKNIEEKVRERELQVEVKEEQLNLLKERQIEIDSKEKQLQLTIEDLEFQEKNIHFIRNLNEKRMVELDLKEKEVGSKKEILEKGLKDLESQRKGFVEQIKEFELRKKEHEQFLLEFHSKIKDLLLQKELHEEEIRKLLQEKEEFLDRVKQFELDKSVLEKSLKEFDLEKMDSLKRTQLLEKESKDLESKWRKFEHRTEELNVREKLIKEDYKHLESKKKELVDSAKKFELKEKELGLNEKKVESEKKSLEKDSKHLESKRKELEEMIKNFESREREFELNHKKIESEKKLLEKDSKHLESARKELDEKIKNFELRLKQLESREEKHEAGKKLIEEDSKSLESRRKELEERIGKLELREKQLDLKEKQLSGPAPAHLKTELGSDPVNQSSSNTDIRFVAMTMGGKDLQIFLNEQEKNHHSMAGEIAKALHLLKDPAKLVLDAMEGFFPPHLSNGNGEFSTIVVRKSCMLLLQQLIKISPEIQPCVRDNALKLAREWKAKLNIDCSLEVSCFLYLLGIYSLASSFDAEEIFSFLKFISKDQEKLEPGLCGRLGLEEKISSFIENLLERNQNLEAVKFIYGFDLVDCFPPVPILRSYLYRVKMYGNKMFRNGRKKDEIVDARIAALRGVIKCIVDYNLESEYSTKDPENCIKQLLKQKKKEEVKGSSDPKVEVKQMSSTAPGNQQPNAQSYVPLSQPEFWSCESSSPPKAQSSAPNLSDTVKGSSYYMAVIIANMNGKKLICFLGSYWSELEQLRNEMKAALQISSNSPKLVLDAVENLFDSHLTDDESKSCIFLLEQLLALSPDIMPDVKEAAQNIAFNWQKKLKASNSDSRLTLAYLLLVSAYKLDSIVNRDKLQKLYQIVLELKPSPVLSDALGISKDVSSAAPLQSQVETQNDASRSVLANNVTQSTSMVPTGFDDQQPLCILSKPDLILDALIYCHQSNLSGNKTPQLVVRNFYHLLEHLTSFLPKIEPEVKDRAHNFFLHWTEKPLGSYIPETLARLQFISAYQLSSVLTSDQIFSLLEAIHSVKKVASFIRMFGLVDKVPDFILKLNKKKQHLVSFDYVYEFGLADTFPPVALLKQHVRYSKVVANRIFHKGQRTREAQEKSIETEISSLRTVIRLIIHHKLELEYPPDELKSTIIDLEIQRANLKIQMQKDLEIQINNKRHRPTSDSMNEATNLQPVNKFRRLDSHPQFSSSHQIAYQTPPPLSQHPTEDVVGGGIKDVYAHSNLRRPGMHYGGTQPPFQNELLPYNQNGHAYHYSLPQLWMEGKQPFNQQWHNPIGHNPHTYM